MADNTKVVFKEIQWKYDNNSVVDRGYVRGEVQQDDCPLANTKFIVATIPKGVIVKGITAYTEGYTGTTPYTFKVGIGMNDCVLCEPQEMTCTDTQPACTDACTCKMQTQDSHVIVELEDILPTGNLIVLVDIIDPNRVKYTVQPKKLEVVSMLMEPCKDSTCTSCSSTNADVDGTVVGG